MIAPWHTLLSSHFAPSTFISYLGLLHKAQFMKQARFLLSAQESPICAALPMKLNSRRGPAAVAVPSHLEGLLKQMLARPQSFCFGALGWGSRICISN